MRDWRDAYDRDHQSLISIAIKYAEFSEHINVNTATYDILNTIGSSATYSFKVRARWRNGVAASFSVLFLPVGSCWRV